MPLWRAGRLRLRAPEACRDGLPTHADAGIGNTPLIVAVTLLNLLRFCMGLRPIAGLAGGSGRGPIWRRGPFGMPPFSLLSHAIAVTRQGSSSGWAATVTRFWRSRWRPVK